jgi:hypothetical protein
MKEVPLVQVDRALPSKLKPQAPGNKKTVEISCTVVVPG